jgi:limonene-1,2-epoxide hydrolase
MPTAKTTQTQASAENVKQTIEGLANAFNDENFRLAREYVSDSIEVSNPVVSHHNAEAYFEEAERLHVKFKIIKILVDGDEACVMYDVTHADVTTFAIGWFQVKDGKIASMRVVFDPRPLSSSAEQASKPGRDKDTEDDPDSSKGVTAKEKQAQVSVGRS